MKKGRQFDVVLLGIVFDPAKKRILIGKKEKENVKEITWCFPGGKIRTEKDIDNTLKDKIKSKTGLEIANLGSVFSLIPRERKDLLLIYFLCEVIGGEAKPLGDFKELRWVKPNELESNLTASFHPHLKEYVMNLT